MTLRAQMLDQWKAQRIVWAKVRNQAADEVRMLDEMIASFGESGRVKKGP